jgi:hypothetical protein
LYNLPEGRKGTSVSMLKAIIAVRTVKKIIIKKRVKIRR